MFLPNVTPPTCTTECWCRNKLPELKDNNTESNLAMLPIPDLVELSGTHDLFEPGVTQGPKLFLVAD